MAVAAPPRPRSGSGRLFVIVGVLLAVLAFGGVLVFGGSHGGGLTGATTDVVVASRDIPFRGVIGPDDVVTQKFSTADVPPNSFSRTKDVQDLIAQVQISKGQPLTSNMLAKSPDQVTGRTAGFLPIPQGFVAVTMPTSELQGVAGYIAPNDYISIIATVQLQLFLGNQASGPQKTVTKTIFTNVHVLRIGAATNQVTSASGNSSQTSSQTGGVSSSITFVVTACDSEFLQWFRAVGTLSYELESYKDYTPQDKDPNPTCASVNAAHGVGPRIVDQRYGFTQLGQ